MRESSNRIFVLIIVSMGFFLVTLDATVVNVALVSLKSDLGIGLSGLQLTIAAYTVSFAAFLLSSGSFGDRMGPRKIFCFGLFLFTISSFLCGEAGSLPFLVFSRILQGIGAALLVANSLTLLQGIYIDPSERAKAYGVWAGVGGVAIAAGPVIGAILIANFGWPSAFYLNIPFGAVGLFMAKRYVPEMKLVHRKMNPISQIFIAIALGSIAYTFIAAGSTGWASTQVELSAILFFIVLVIFLLIEHVSKSPMIPKGIFRIRKFTAVTIIGLIINFGFYGQLFVISLYFQQFKQYSTIATGFALLPQAIVMALTAFYCGRITARTGPVIPIAVGLGISLIGLTWLGFTNSASTYIAVIIPMLLIGFGNSSTAPATVATGMSSAPPGHEGIVSGMISAARQSGSVMGVAILGSLVGNQAFSIQGMHVAMEITLPLYVLALVLTMFFIYPEHKPIKTLKVNR